MSDLRNGGRGAPEPNDLAETLARKLGTSIMIAGGLIALAVYWQDAPEAPDYQIAASADGRVYRVNTDSGWIVGCEGKTCQILLDDDTDLRGTLPERVRQALPAPEGAQTGGNEAAPVQRPAEPAKN